MKQVKELETVASQVRRDVIRMVAAVNSGHPGGSLGAADVMTALYFKVMAVSPAKFTFTGKDEDMFFLSNGHISPLFYSVLARCGYFGVAELATFRIMGSRLQGHPTPAKGLPGVRMASGSLGQGLSNAIGAAIAKRLDGDMHKVYVMMGDGELQEGQVWEAAAFAVARKVDNVVAIVDMNSQQIDGTCEQVMAGFNASLRQKWEAFGWRVLEVDGHNMGEIVKTLEYARDMVCGKGIPVVVLAKTIMGKGVDFMEDTCEFHGKATNAEQTARALGQLRETLGDY